MKIERKPEAFNPITITLETEEEARALMTAVGCVGYMYNKTAGKFYTELYSYLDIVGVKDYPTEGSITITGN